MNIHHEAKQIWPGLSNTDLDIALWSLTTFPMGNEEEVLAALKNAYEISGGDLLQALHQADEARTKSQTIDKLGGLPQSESGV